MWVRIILGIAALVAAWAIPTGQADASSGRYIDDDRSRYEGFIEALSEAGLVHGCNPPDNDRFCPHRLIERVDLAIMLDRGLGLEPAGSDFFEDDNGHPGEGSINALAEAGVTNGCEPGKFCPDRPLSRGEMAQLIATALGWSQKANTSRYADIEGSSYAGALTALAARDGLEPCDLPEARRLCPDSLVARDEAAFAVAAALDLSPVRVDSERNGPEVGFEDSFDELALWDGRRTSSRNRVGLTDGGYRGSGLKVSIPRGSHYGADFKLDLADVVGEDPHTLFFRYYLRFDPGWEPRASGKLPGFSGIYNYTGKGGYRSSPSAPGWSARMKFSGNRPDDPRARLGYYVYHLGQERRYGDGMNWNEAGMLQPGDWYCIEGQIEINTPGVADGALRAWVDGTPVFDEAGIEFRRPSEPEISVESFWFNVYYGGKPVAPKSLGLTVDEVAVDGARIGCGSGGTDIRAASGDFTGDGWFADRVAWSACETGPCFTVQTLSEKGRSGRRSLGNGGWFSLETHRLGILLADVDGDGDDDLLYRGRCGSSEKCWRVHRAGQAGVGPGENWGDGARFVPSSRLVAGDWNGDGLDDVAYPAECGSAPAHPCWRVHLSDGSTFAGPADWGPPPDGFDAAPQAGDVNGDGKDDVVYAARCGEQTCWYTQLSNGSGFDAPVQMGKARAQELSSNVLFDFDGDGRDDLVSVSGGENESTVEVRHATNEGFAGTTPLTSVEGSVAEVLLRRSHPAEPVEALAVRQCESPGGCVERFLSLGDELATPARYARAKMVELIRSREVDRPGWVLDYQ